MPFVELSAKAAQYLQRLCLEIPTRHVGSPGNRAATEFFAEVVASFGLRTETQEFDCIDWATDAVRLVVDGDVFEANGSPYSLSCQVSAPLAVVSTVEELEAVEAANAILLMRGGITKEQLMPKNFPFYNPDEHRRIIHLLESKTPRAIIAATSRNPEVAGAVYPFPLIEDGDFDIPSVYMTDEEGSRLARRAGEQISLDVRSARIPARGCNVIAHQGGGANRRVVVCAHIDAKPNMPGAIDNATGVTTLLLLAELLEGYGGRLGVEIVALNGEEYYSSPGEVRYLRGNEGRLSEILLSINLDGAGFHQGDTVYSLYECPDATAGAIREVFSSRQDMREGDQWYQSDHMIFAQNRVPALAITSQRFMALLGEIAHTTGDVPGIVDCAKLVNAALALRELVLDLDGRLA
jgi:aminopeptidase YwaD